MTKLMGLNDYAVREWINDDANVTLPKFTVTRTLKSTHLEWKFILQPSLSRVYVKIFGGVVVNFVFFQTPCLVVWAANLVKILVK